MAALLPKFLWVANTGRSTMLYQQSIQPAQKFVCVIVGLVADWRKVSSELGEVSPYSCPCPGTSCKWLGQLDQVMPHLLQSHKCITTLQGEDIVFLATDITLPGAVDWVMMQSCFGHYFMLVLEKQERVSSDQFFFALVLLIGTKKQADQFVYK
ncbi:hypothetical protein ACTXT7_012684 [Hymenolepis weldensis]